MVFNFLSSGRVKKAVASFAMVSVLFPSLCFSTNPKQHFYKKTPFVESRADVGNALFNNYKRRLKLEFTSYYLNNSTLKFKKRLAYVLSVLEDFNYDDVKAFMHNISYAKNAVDYIIDNKLKPLSYVDFLVSFSAFYVFSSFDKSNAHKLMYARNVDVVLNNTKHIFSFYSSQRKLFLSYRKEFNIVMLFNAYCHEFVHALPFMYGINKPFNELATALFSWNYLLPIKEDHSNALVFGLRKPNLNLDNKKYRENEYLSYFVAHYLFSPDYPLNELFNTSYGRTVLLSRLFSILDSEQLNEHFISLSKYKETAIKIAEFIRTNGLRTSEIKSILLNEVEKGTLTISDTVYLSMLLDEFEQFFAALSRVNIEQEKRETLRNAVIDTIVKYITCSSSQCSVVEHEFRKKVISLITAR